MSCSICNKPTVGRGFCKAHYRALRKYGDPLIRKNFRGVPFADRYSINTTTNCWEWQASVNKGGYGIYNQGREQLAHRVSWVNAHGAIPQTVCVLHRCDNRKCVNPAHLFLGSQLDNIADMKQKNRAKTRPQISPETKTNVQQLSSKKNSAGKFAHTLREVAKLCGVNLSTVQRYATKRTK